MVHAYTAQTQAEYTFSGHVLQSDQNFWTFVSTDFIL